MEKTILGWFLMYAGSLFLFIPIAYVFDKGAVIGVIIVIHAIWAAIGLICLGVKFLI